MTQANPRRTRSLAVALLTALAALPAAAEGQPTGDPAAGREKARICAGCHGPEGIATLPRYPHLAGQNAPYLVRAITAYRDGARQDPEMTPMAASLSDADIRDLTAFYASRPRCPR